MCVKTNESRCRVRRPDETVCPTIPGFIKPAINQRLIKKARPQLGGMSYGWKLNQNITGACHQSGGRRQNTEMPSDGDWWQVYSLRSRDLRCNIRQLCEGEPQPLIHWSPCGRQMRSTLTELSNRRQLLTAVVTQLSPIQNKRNGSKRESYSSAKNKTI